MAITGAAAHRLRALVLLNRFTTEVTQVTARTLGPNSTSNAQVLLLVRLATVGSSSPSQLATDLGMSRSAVSRLLRIAADDGLIRRRLSEHDRRAVLVRLSARGRRRFSDFEAAMAQTFVDAGPLVHEVLALVEQRPTAPTGQLAMPSVLELVDRLGRLGEQLGDGLAAVQQELGLHLQTCRSGLLEICEAGELRPTQLARLLGLSTSGITSLLDRLEAAGLVSRERPAGLADRRSVAVTATPAGEEVARAMADVVAAHEIELSDVLSATQRVSVSSMA